MYERALLERLLDVTFQPFMLVLADRGFYSYELWRRAAKTGAALLWRVPVTVRLPVGRIFDDGSYLSELLPRGAKTDLNRGKRRSVPDGMRIPVRVIEYRIGNRKSAEVFRLVTTLLDPNESPASELAALYAERWEFELGLDENETHQIAGSRLCDTRSLSWWNGRSGHCSSLTTRYDISCTTPPRTSVSTRTGCPSYAVSGSSGAVLPTGRASPLATRMRFWSEHAQKSSPPQPRPAAPQLPPGCQEKTDRGQLLKRQHHQEVRHNDPPKVRVESPAA